MKKLRNVVVAGLLVLGAMLAVRAWRSRHEVVVFENGTGLSLAYDPNLHDPSTGFRGCVSGINSCFAKGKHWDECVRASPRCSSATPWKDDPGGPFCCPESCIYEYFENRKSVSESTAIYRFVDGYCYPGMKEILTGRKE